MTDNNQRVNEQATREAFDKIAQADGLDIERGFKDGYRDADTRAAFRGFKLALQAIEQRASSAPAEENVEADAYMYACDLMEQFQAERAKRGVEIGTQGSLCDGIAWVYDRLKKLEVEQAAPEAPAAASVKTWQEHINQDGLYCDQRGRLYGGWTAVTLARDAEIADLRAAMALAHQSTKEKT